MGSMEGVPWRALPGWRWPSVRAYFSGMNTLIQPHRPSCSERDVDWSLGHGPCQVVIKISSVFCLPMVPSNAWAMRLKRTSRGQWEPGPGKKV